MKPQLIVINDKSECHGFCFGQGIFLNGGSVRPFFAIFDNDKFFIMSNCTF
jgi:hypothetical protein